MWCKVYIVQRPLFEHSVNGVRNLSSLYHIFFIGVYRACKLTTYNVRKNKQYVEAKFQNNSLLFFLLLHSAAHVDENNE